MAVATQLEVVDLRHFSARQMRPLLEAEARLWRERLRWDYTGSAELLLQYLDSRVLPGYVALDRGRITGYMFCVYEGQKAVVGDAFSFGGSDPAALRTTGLLLKHGIELLRASPGVSRIESQLLLYDSGALDPVFLPEGFRCNPRLFMEHDLLRYGPSSAPLPENAWRGRSGELLRLERWSAARYQPAAELIHAAYAGHIDSTINDQYRSLHGSLRFLHNIVRFPGCGVFAPEHSWVLVDARTEALAAVVLCSRVEKEVAHVTQLCVAPDQRGGRLGEHLLRHTMGELRVTGSSALTLTVTGSNAPALELYRRLGFAVRQRFDAMVLEDLP